MLSRTRMRCAKVALGRTDALNGIDGARAGRPRYNSPTNPQIPFTSGKPLKKPALMQPSMADVDAPKMEMYNLGKDWIVIYTKDGRPYYYNQETEETTWVHPSTGVALPPSKPPAETRTLPVALKWLGRCIFYSIGGVMLWAAMGGAPLLARLISSGDSAVVQVRKKMSWFCRQGRS